MNAIEYLEGLKKNGHECIDMKPSEFYSSKTGRVADACGIPDPTIPKIFTVWEEELPIFTLNFVPLMVEFHEDEVRKQVQREVMVGERIIELDDKDLLTEKDWYNHQIELVKNDLLGTTSYHLSTIFWTSTGEKAAVYNLTFLYSNEMLSMASIHISTELNGKKRSIPIYEPIGDDFIKDNIISDVNKFKQLVISGIEKYLYSFH